MINYDIIKIYTNSEGENSYYNCTLATPNYSGFCIRSNINNTTEVVTISSEGQIYLHKLTLGTNIYKKIYDDAEYIEDTSTGETTYLKIEHSGSKFIEVTKSESGFLLLVEKESEYQILELSISDNYDNIIESTISKVENNIITTNNYILTLKSTLTKDKFPNVKGLCYYRQNNIYFISNNNIIRYSINNNTIQMKKEIQFINDSSKTDINYNSEDNTVWILNNGKLFILDETFTKLQQVNIPDLVKDSIDFIVNSGKLYFNIESIGGANYYDLFLDTETIKIKEIYYATIPIKKILSYVENSDKILWNILSGCFSSGIWLQEEIWNKDDLWKDNNN